MPPFQVLEQLGQMSAQNEVTLPKGALASSSNVVIRHAGVLESRRGEKFIGQSLGVPAATTFGVTNDRSDAGCFFGATPVIHYGTKLATYSPGAFVDLTGSYTAPDDSLLRMKFAEAARSLLITTDAGLFIMDDATFTPGAVGVPRAWDFQRDEVALDGNPGDGWMSTDSAVAYRVVWSIKDGNKREKTGEPSGRCVVHNMADVVVPVGDVAILGSGYVLVSAPAHGLAIGDLVTVSPGETGLAAGTYAVDAASGITADSFYLHPGGAPPSGVSTLEQTISSGTKNVALRVRIPWTGITTAHYFKIYRSLESATMNTPPDDELYQVYEGTIDAGDITAGYIDFTDKVPQSLLNLGGPLYTNANTGDGLDAANALPPLCKDVCVWDDRVFAINTTERHTFHLQLLGVGSPDGVQDGDTIDIEGLLAEKQFVAKNSPTLPTHFQIHAIDTPEKNIERTAQNLCDTINQNEDLEVWAFYESGPSGQDVPGKILLIEREIGGSANKVYASRPASWNPPLTTTNVGAQESDNARRKNGLSYSKRYEPDHWPRYNYEEVGSANWELLRAVPLGDKLYCFPQVGGIWTLSGQAPYVVKNVDESATLIAPDTAVVHNNQIFALTTQGFVSIGEGGVRILSEPIKDELDALLAAGALTSPTANRLAFCVAYESDRTVTLWLPDGEDEMCNVGFVYNSFEETWTKRTGNRKWGAIHPTENRLYMGEGQKNTLRVERKDFARTDYADESLAVTIAASPVPNAEAVTLSDASGVTVGDILWQSGVKLGLVTAKNGNALTLFSTGNDFTAGAAQVEVAIAASARYAAANPGGPDALKKFVDVTLHFRRFFAKVFSVLFTSEIGTTEKSRTATRTDYTTAAQTLAALMFEPGPINKPVQVPIEQSECTQLRVGFSVREAWAVWALNGHTLQYEPISQTKGAR